MQRPYPLPLEKSEKPSSLTLSCGLGLGYIRMILAYFGKHGSKESDEHNRAIQPIARFSQSRDSATRTPILYHWKSRIFNPVVWVRVWFWVNDTCLFCGPLWSLPGHIFRFFVSCTGPEEIVPEISRGKRRKKKNKNNF